MLTAKFVQCCPFYKEFHFIITRYYAEEGWRRLYIISQHHGTYSLYTLTDGIKGCVLFSLLQNNTSLELGQVIGPTEGDLEKIRSYTTVRLSKRGHNGLYLGF
jgi:hypothetical protein